MRCIVCCQREEENRVIQEISDVILAFLREGKEHELRYMARDYSCLLIRSPYDRDTDFLYLLDEYKSESPYRVNCDAKFAGIYSRTRDIICGACYELNEVVDESHSIGKETLLHDISCCAAERVVQMVDGKPVEETEESASPWKDEEYFLKFQLDSEAKDHFYARTQPEFKPYIAIQEVPTPELVWILNHPDEAIQRYADQYIRKNAKCINRRIWEIPLVRQRLQEMEAAQMDAGSKWAEAHMRREISESIHDEKMVRIEIDREGKRMEIRYEARYLHNRGDSYYTTYGMDAPSKRQFAETFGRNADLYPRDIARILYGKKVLYEQCGRRQTDEEQHYPGQDTP